MKVEEGEVSDMYYPKEYMTVEVVSEVMSELEWPAPYTIEEDLPDGIAVLFPKCTLYFVEGFRDSAGRCVRARFRARLCRHPSR